MATICQQFPQTMVNDAAMLYIYLCTAWILIHFISFFKLPQLFLLMHIFILNEIILVLYMENQYPLPIEVNHKNK